MDRIEILVLDEADWMLDMGFLPDVRRILKHLPRARQTMLFSATMPQEITGLAREIMRNPVTINIERKMATAVGITHAVYPVPRDLKPALLLELLNQNVIDDAIVFTRTKHRADRLAAYLGRNGISVARIHGNRSQSQRTAALAGFKSRRHRVLVATDIVARGIDVESLGHVLNFDVPADPGAYVHRVGRTARAEATGSAFTLVSPEEEGDIRAIEAALGQRLPRVTLPSFDYKGKHEGAFGRSGKRHAGGRGAGGARHPGGRPARESRHTAGRRKRSSSSGQGLGREARFQAILDKYAPVGAAPKKRLRGR